MEAVAEKSLSPGTLSDHGLAQHWEATGHVWGEVFDGDPCLKALSSPRPSPVRSPDGCGGEASKASLARIGESRTGRCFGNLRPHLLKLVAQGLTLLRLTPHRLQ